MSRSFENWPNNGCSCQLSSRFNSRFDNRTDCLPGLSPCKLDGIPPAKFLQLLNQVRFIVDVKCLAHGCHKLCFCYLLVLLTVRLAEIKQVLNYQLEAIALAAAPIIRGKEHLLLDLLHVETCNVRQVLHLLHLQSHILHLNVTLVEALQVSLLADVVHLVRVRAYKQDALLSMLSVLPYRLDQPLPDDIERFDTLLCCL